MRLQASRIMHKGSLYANLRRSEPVVRGGVEPPTFRFSVLRITVHSRPPRFICLIQNPRRPRAYFPARTRMRQELRPRAFTTAPTCLASAQRHRTRPAMPSIRVTGGLIGCAHRPGQAPRPAPAQPTWQRIRLGRIHRPGSLADCAVETTACGARRLWARPVLPRTRPDQRCAAGRRGGVPGCPQRDACGQLPTAGGRVVGQGSGGRAGRCRPRTGRARADARSRPAQAAHGVDGGGVPRHAGAGRPAATACSSTAPRPGAARSWSATRCCGCAGTTGPPRRRW